MMNMKNNIFNPVRVSTAHLNIRRSPGNVNSFPVCKEIHSGSGSVVEATARLVFLLYFANWQFETRMRERHDERQWNLTNVARSASALILRERPHEFCGFREFNAYAQNSKVTPKNSIHSGHSKHIPICNVLYQSNSTCIFCIILSSFGFVVS